MSMLTSAQMADLVRELDAEAVRAQAVVSGASPPATLVRPEPGDQTDVADQEITERQADAMLEHYRAQLADIDAARARIAQGVYGICTDCSESIPFARLQAYPTAKRCTACQSARERQFAVSQ